jgi:AraC-like DNA-binding protein
MSLPPDAAKAMLNPRAAQEQLRLAWFAPAADLADVVERHWTVQWDFRGREPFVQEVLPHPSANLCFEPGGAVVHAVITRRAVHRLEGRGRTLGTSFRPAAFAAFVPTSMAELADRGVGLGHLFGEAGDALEREVLGLADARRQIAAVEAFLRARRAAPDPVARRVEEMIAWMLAAPASTRVADVAAEFGLSTRELQRRFRRYVGAGPKWVLQRYRLHDAAGRIASGRGGGWAAVALELGYADQAHFIRDFKALVGCSPGAYEAACAP